jgi:hypothetical protein
MRVKHLYVVMSCAVAAACVGGPSRVDGIDGGTHWRGCEDASRFGQNGDSCEFAGGCRVNDHTPLVQCVRGMLLLQRTSVVEDVECYAGAAFEGDCVSYASPPGAECSDDLVYSETTICPVIEPSRQLDEPWLLESDLDCPTLFRAAAVNGDPCTGEHVCEIDWPGERPREIAARVTAWCANGRLHMVDVGLAGI